MTGLQIYNMASAMLYEDTGTNIKEERYSVHFLNRLIAEAYMVEQNMREAEGSELLTEIPWVDTIEQEIPYHEQMLRTAFVYGLAMHYWQEELDTYQAETCKAEYLAALNDCRQGVWVSI